MDTTLESVQRMTTTHDTEKPKMTAPGLSDAKPGRIVVGITGASGAIYGVRLLQALATIPVESHLVMTAPAELTLTQEMDITPSAVKALATHTYDPADIGAAIASGSFATVGMVIAPCSIKTLSGIAGSYTDNLLIRAADVTLKEGRPLILAVRETPLHLGHLRLMVRAAEIGAIIFPPVPAFYGRPASVAELVDQSVGRMLARLGLHNELYTVWQGETAS
jgi:4-hydroxy-3-polyprenylbenzoate decarboxylase